MGYLSNIKKQYLINLFQSLIPAYIIERLFWQERGMNVQMVVYCEIIYAVTVVVFEIPSGILADKFGRKRLLIINGALSAAEFVVLLFADSFWMFGLAVFMSGIGKAFSSGSQNALLYDSLLLEGEESRFEKLIGRLYAVDFVGSMIAAISGGVLANLFGFEFNYIVSFFSMSGVFVITLFLKEPQMITKPEGDLTGVTQYAKQAMTVFREKRLVLIYCLSGAVVGACLIYLDEFWQLILDEIGIPIVFFGAVGAMVLLFRIPGNLLAYKLKERFGSKSIITVIILLNAVGYFSIFFIRNFLCVVPITVVSLTAGVLEPLVMGYLHRNTESQVRATAESFSSLGMRLISVIIGLAFGYISTHFSIFSGFVLLGTICCGYFLFFTGIKKKD